MYDKNEFPISELIFGGMGLAAMMSWLINKSVVWTIIHGLLGWIYLIYVFFKYC